MKKINFILSILFTGLNLSYACTGFYISKNDNIFAGNNEDFNYPITKMWTVSGSNDSYGRIYFGYDDYNPQGGINEKGLFFDGFAVDNLPISYTCDKPKYDKFFNDIRNEILSSCANVKEVIELLNMYNLSDNSLLENGMLFFGDSEGNSVIIDGANFISKSSDFQVVTNFHPSNVSTVACERYKTATRLLEKISIPTVDACKNILDSVHVSNTLYSQVYDIKEMKIYIYNFHNFNNPYVVDINNELTKGNSYYNIPEFFKHSEAYENFKIQNLDIRYLTSFNERYNKNIGKTIDKNYQGNYRYVSFQSPDEETFIINDTLNLITVEVDDNGVYLLENYSVNKKFRIFPEKQDLYFYFTRSYRTDILFKPDNEIELINQTYYPYYKWIGKLKKYEP